MRNCFLVCTFNRDTHVVIKSSFFASQHKQETKKRHTINFNSVQCIQFFQPRLSAINNWERREINYVLKESERLHKIKNMNMDFTKIGETDLIKEYLLQSSNKTIRLYKNTGTLLCTRCFWTIFLFCTLNGRKLISLA